MLKLLPWARRTSHATRMLVSTRSVAALIAAPSRRYQATPVTQTPNRTMPEIDRAMIRGASPKAIPRRGARDFPARIGESNDIFESPRERDAIRPKEHANASASATGPCVGREVASLQGIVSRARLICVNFSSVELRGFAGSSWRLLSPCKETDADRDSSRLPQRAATGDLRINPTSSKVELRPRSGRAPRRQAALTALRN